MSPERAVAVMRDAFAADGEGKTRVPPVINLDIPAAHGEFHIKTAYIEGVPYVAVKVASGFYDNPRRGLPSMEIAVMAYPPRVVGKDRS